jgi:hypothetical protein
VLFVAGCGTKPLPPPDPLAVREPGRLVAMRDPGTGLRFRAPVNWVKRARQAPGMFRIASGGADVSGWGYFRPADKLPATRADLATARDALVRQARARSASFRLTGSKLTDVQGWPAIELLATQDLFGKSIETRSVHIFRGGEYVIEALAPPRDFDLTNTKVLEPLLQSLRFQPLPPS